MLGQFPLGSKAVSVQGNVPTTKVYAQVMTGTNSQAASYVKRANKLWSLSSQTNTTFGNTSANFPTLGINNTAIGGANSWSTPGNITANDGAYSNSTSITTGSTNYLVATGFGFSVPTNVTILGVALFWSRSSVSSATGSVFNCILWNGSSTTVDQSIGLAQSYNAGGGTTGTIGSSTNTWGATLTPTIVNSSTFGAAFFNTATSGATLVNLDYCTITVYYAIPPFPLFQKFISRAISATQSSAAIGAVTSTTIPLQNFTTTPTLGTFSGAAVWTNLSNALTSDGTYATQIVPSSNTTDSLRFYLKDFGLPAGAIVTDFSVSVLWRSTNASLASLGFQFADGVSGSEVFYGAVGSFILSANNTWETHTFPLGANNIGVLSIQPTQLTAAWWNATNSTIDIYGLTSGAGVTSDVDVLQMAVVYQVTGSNLQKTINLTKSLAQASTVSYAKQALKTLSSASTSVVTWLASKLSSTTTYYQTMIATQSQSALFSKFTQKLWSAGSTSAPILAKQSGKGWALVSTSVPSLIKQISRVWSVSSTSMPTLIKQIGKTWSVSSTSVPSLIKQMDKTWSVSSTSVPSLIKQFAHTWFVSSTSAPSLIKQIGKSWLVSSTTVATFLRSLVHLITWSVSSTSVPSLIKQMGKSWSVSSTSVPLLKKQFAHTWSVSSTSVPLLIKQFAHTWSVSSTSISTFLKGALHYVIMSATQSQAVSWIKTTGKTWSVSSTSVPLLKKQMNKGWSSISTSVPSLIKTTGKTWSISSTSVPLLIKQSGKTLASSSTSVPKLIKQIGKSWSVSSTSVSTLLKSTIKSLSTISTSVPSLIKQMGKTWSVSSTSISTFLKGALHYVIMSATQSQAVSWIKTIGKTLASSSTSVPLLKKQMNKSLTISSTSVPSLNKGISRLWSITQTSISMFNKGLQKSLSSSTSSIGFLNKYTYKVLSINSSTIGVFSKGFNIVWSTTQGSISTLDTLRQAFVRPFNLLSSTLNDWKQYALTIYQSYYQFVVDKRVFEAQAKATTETIPYQWVFLKAQPYSASIIVRLLNGMDANPTAILQGSPIIGTNSVTQVITGGNDGCIYNLVATIQMKDGTIKVLETYLPVSAI